MAEYINREKILEDIGTDIAAFTLSMVFRHIRNAPPADVAEVKHGKWIWDPNGMDWGLGTWKCSECACRNNNLPMNNRINPLVFSGSKYCPNCGAKMDLED